MPLFFHRKRELLTPPPGFGIGDVCLRRFYLCRFCPCLPFLRRFYLRRFYLRRFYLRRLSEQVYLRRFDT